ncbi:AAA family ATPase [Herpetosiphon llansteffanensis]|uniref:AAA family ATPase n=1 Tax=Herpetosiphon llansteffanensis TaxID=2094568 RepID=UPI000D7BA179|nr:AAA family ATPase [Herpetosiphon llansteffanensis]
MDSRAAIFIITGAPGVGKTSVARQLAQRFDLSLHIPTDELRSWVIAGKAEPIPVLTPAAHEQLRLAREVVRSMATLYRANGYTVIIDAVLTTHDIDGMFAQSDQPQLHKILLCPTLEHVLARNQERYAKFDLETWGPVIAALYQDLRLQNTADQGWIVLDSGGWSIEQTVDAMLQAVRSEAG